jgi:nucleotide-binding universal stress UspA family protein
MKIVVPLDGSAEAEGALPEAIKRAKENAGARLVLVRAVDPGTVPAIAGSDAQARAISEAAEYLQKVATRLRSHGVERVGRAVWFAPPGLALMEAMRTVRPDLIVMSDFRRDTLDSVAGSMAAFIEPQPEMPGVAVLTVRSAERTLNIGTRGERIASGVSAA